MKKYIKPISECYIVNTPALLLDMSEGAADPETPCDAKRRHNKGMNNWENMNDWEEDEEDPQNTLF